MAHLLEFGFSLITILYIILSLLYYILALLLCEKQSICSRIYSAPPISHSHLSPHNSRETPTAHSLRRGMSIFREFDILSKLYLHNYYAVYNIGLSYTAIFRKSIEPGYQLCLLWNLSLGVIHGVITWLHYIWAMAYNPRGYDVHAAIFNGYLYGVIYHENEMKTCIKQ